MLEECRILFATDSIKAVVKYAEAFKGKYFKVIDKLRLNHK